jgi:hypothetical protein
VSAARWVAAAAAVGVAAGWLVSRRSNRVSRAEVVAVLERAGRLQPAGTGLPPFDWEAET